MAGVAQGDQQGTTPDGHLDPDETKIGTNALEQSKKPRGEKRDESVTDEKPIKTTGSPKRGHNDGENEGNTNQRGAQGEEANKAVLPLKGAGCWPPL